MTDFIGVYTLLAFTVAADQDSSFNYAQIVVTVLLSSGFVGGVMALLTKQMWSPESKNDLARLGNELAHQLLVDAKTEREELRLTIRELESTITEKGEVIARLNKIAHEKDRMISDLEDRQHKLALKIHLGEPITLYDIFGKHPSTEDPAK